MRTRMVTRTVKTTKVTAMTVNVENATIENVNFDIVGEYKEKELEKLAKEFVESVPNVKFVSIIATETTEQIYGMPESEFMQYAKPITR